MPLPSLLAFGPQASWRSTQHISQYRDILVLEPRFRPFINAIKDLPALWSALVASDPRLKKVSGLDSIQQILRWLEGDDVSPTQGPLSNTLTTVITLIIHFTQYLYYIDHDIDYPSHSKVLDTAKNAGVQGFCIGLLSAAAVACSNNEEELGVHGATALRLAFCIGAYVDLGRYTNGETHLLAVRWRTETSHERVEELLKTCPNAYISVIAGKANVTVTVEEAHVASLSQELSEEGMRVVPLGLGGRYHTATNEEAFGRLLKFCEGRDDLCLPDVQGLSVPLRSNATSRLFEDGSLTRHVLRNILCDQCGWYQTILAAVSDLQTSEDRTIMGLGITRVIPPSLSKEFGLKVIEGNSWSLLHRGASGDPFATPSIGSAASTTRPRSPYGDNAIAVVGMACKFPGADSIDEFWNLLTKGTSMVSEMPEDRFQTKGLRRTPDGKLRFFGNFVRDIQAFDHRFFKKSSREAASMDPQQRLILQCAYEAMESSGHFGALSEPATDIGCFVGICTNDYNDNVASHNPNAYSGLGTLRAFVAGKISHYFGWSGPSLTIDTACSSSAVAIHDACRALQLDECSQAIAGGVNLFTSPYLYENLAAASFLSPTGQTKPFDAKGDGYCRGEGVGLVVLKKLSNAIADGDNIMGVISSSGINQNSNCVGITVPHSASQAALYNRVAGLAGIDTREVSYVEAHGTGTPVGDPKEIASIRDVFGDAKRIDPLYVSSVKGNIGHLEAASGIASLIKTLLMMKTGIVPVQASFNTLNPSIPPLESDRIVIPTANSKWNAKFKIACINNYGASGSNATMIVCEPPAVQRSRLAESSFLPKYPFFISAYSSTSLAAYCSALRRETLDVPAGIERREFLASLSYNLAVKQNRALPRAVIFAASDLEDFHTQLLANSTEDVRELSIPPKAKPVVLVFGGQVNDAVGLNKDLYDCNQLFRRHLDECDTVVRSFGLSGLYPEIFQSTPVSNIVSLQAMVFSLQYSCSKAWMESGLKIDAVVGHSLGQLAAMCIAGTLSLEEGLKLVSGRASLMQKHWGEERGSMIAIEANTDLISKIIATVDEGIEVACYNGPTGHVLVGSDAAITRVQKLLVDPAFAATKIKSKRLNVTHGFHSVFTEDLLPSLTTLAGELAFKDPVIHLETCSDKESWSRPNAQLIAEHTRSPVYFGQAIERLTKRFGQCTWLEAGSSSSVIGMVRRALDPNTTSEHSFESASFTNPKALESLSDITINLWKSGHRMQLWSFHSAQKHQYTQIDLPPYQFEKSTHWLEWKEPSGANAAPPEPAPKPTVNKELLSLVKFSDSKKLHAEFSINTLHESWKAHVIGHAVLGEPLCPANLYVELVTRAALQLAGNQGTTSYVPLAENVEITAPLGLAEDRLVHLTMVRTSPSDLSWTFQMASQSDANAKRVSHSTGRLTLQAVGASLLKDFSRYQKLISLKHLSSIRLDPKSEALQGASVYKMFSEVVDYAEYYKSVRGVFARDGEIVGKVIPQALTEAGLTGMITAPLTIDGFVQVSGLHVNSLNYREADQVYVCTKLDRIQVSPDFKADGPENRAWDVYSNFTRIGDKTVSNDIYVFDSVTNRLVVVVFGAYFTRVAISSLARVLSQANKPAYGTSTASSKQTARVSKPVEPAAAVAPLVKASEKKQPQTRAKEARSEGVVSSTMNMEADLQLLLHKVTDIPLSDLKPEVSVEDLGIDSLMVTEIASEVSSFYETDLDAHDLMNLPTIRLLAAFLTERGCTSGSASSRDMDSDIETICDSESVGTATPASIMNNTPESQIKTSVKLMDESSLVERLKKTFCAVMDIDDPISRQVNLASLGVDSLLFMELVSDIKGEFDVEIDPHLFDDDSTFGDLADIVMGQHKLLQRVERVEPKKAGGRGVTETKVYKQVGDLSLNADIYYPGAAPQKKMPVALLIHGGGHCLYTRKDVSTKQIRMLNSRGFVAVSVDYRLCPETTLLEGPMTDVRDALQWIRRDLPRLALDSQGAKVDGGRVAVIGWSTGGTLALSLGFSPPRHGLKPPEAILTFYCPSNYDDDCFRNPIYPRDAIDSPDAAYDLLDSVRDEPFTAYYPPLNKGVPGSFVMGLADPRWRIILHMNWKCQMVPILINGLPTKKQLASSSSSSSSPPPSYYDSLPYPTPAEIASISPYAQIAAGKYATPTFIMHGDDDDLVPCAQSLETVRLLKAKGVKADIAVAEGAGHLFDVFPGADPTGSGRKAVEKGYRFLDEIFSI